MKRRYVLGLVLALVLGISTVLTACGGTASGDGAGGAGAASEAGEAGDGASEDGAAGEGEAGNAADGTAASGSKADKAAELTGNAPAIITTTDWKYLDDISYDEYYCYANATGEAAVVINEGYDKLQKALQKDGEEVAADMDSYIDSLREEGDDFLNDYVKANELSLEYYNNIIMSRCDNTVVSYWREVYADMGGAHPTTAFLGYNYETATGQVLELSDVVQSISYLEERIILDLNNSEYAEDLFDEWENTVRAEFEGTEGYSLPQWVLTDSGITITFNTYELAPYATGSISLDYTFEDEPNLFVSDYLPQEKGLCHKLTYGWSSLEYLFDADDDWSEEILRVSGDMVFSDDGEFYGEYRCIVSYGKDEESLKTTEITIGNYPENCWVMRSISGKYFLYIQDDSYDYGTLQIFDLNSPKKGAKYLGTNTAGAFYTIEPTDSNHVFMMDMAFIMGTHTVYTEGYVGDDGQITSYDGIYYVVDYSYDAIMDSSKDIKPTPEDSYQSLKVLGPIYGFAENGGDAAVFEGETLIPYYTDMSNYMAFHQASDGEIFIIYYDPGHEMWDQYICGKPESELLDGIVYAG